MEKAKVALDAHGTYISSCNLYWLDAWKTPAPGVPLSRPRVQQLADFYFPEDRNNNFFQKLLEVQVDVGTLTDKPTGLVAISPLEIIHAIYLKAAEELGQQGVTAARKTAWSQALSSGIIQRGIFCFSPIMWYTHTHTHCTLVCDSTSSEDSCACAHDRCARRRRLGPRLEQATAGAAGARESQQNCLAERC